MFNFFTKTKKILLATSLAFVLMLALFIYVYDSLREKGEEYRETLQLVANYSQQTNEAQEIEALLANTKEERDRIDEYFLTVIKIAQFLETIEKYARSSGLEITSHSIDTEEVDIAGVATVSMPFSLQGDYQSVIKFIELLETVPYHGYIQSIRIQADPREVGIVNAEAVLKVSYLEND